MKKIIALLMAMAMTMSLAACGGSDAPAETPDAPAVEEAAGVYGCGYNSDMTAVVLVVSSIRNKKGSGLPAALGINYFREDR